MALYVVSNIKEMLTVCTLGLYCTRTKTRLKFKQNDEKKHAFC